MKYHWTDHPDNLVIIDTGLLSMMDGILKVSRGITIWSLPNGEYQVNVATGKDITAWSVRTGKDWKTELAALILQLNKKAWASMAGSSKK